MSDIREQITIIGKQQGGKSYLFGRLADIYALNRGTVVVYNAKREKDYPRPEWTEIKPLSFLEHLKYIYTSKSARNEYKFSPSIEFFWMGKEMVHFERFNEIFFKRKVKIRAINDQKESAEFFATAHKYLSNCLFGIDDCRAFFRHGTKRAHIDFFSARDHSGQYSNIDTFKGVGMDVATIWHHPDHVVFDVWDYTTRTILFKTKRYPELKKIDNPDFADAMRECYEILNEKEKYWYCELDNDSSSFSIRQPI